MSDNNDGSAIIRAAPAEAVSAVFAATVSVRGYMANHHLWWAQRQATICAEREAALVAKGDNNIDFEHRMLAVGAVMAAVAFLEAHVNELFQDAAESPPGGGTYRTQGLSDDAITLMRELWSGDVRAPVLDKYQRALVYVRQSKLAPDAEPYRSADNLMKLRNALVHFVPETQQSDAEHKLTKRLMSSKAFVMNRQAVGSPAFPNKVIAAGCARWACDSAMALVDEWQQRMGLEADYRTYLSGMA
ncbi:hypothetical protein OG921_25760 [Aldersonia sp. NBC_00410]|uniref:hypothetical protein n=1 Tax=Aldersonia sp. NBC_00410 TaxID=2975954 RepID=UPI0022599420|nr:hypothetical protein [Aldersonia sp. NBC_00410]MCX5046583.1 hypothetical protein [Aldersonia sp. NBC_00410]